MLTVNADDHPIMSRMHKPDPKLPPDQQDKRSVVAIEQGNRPVLPAYDLNGSGRKIEPGGASQICAHEGIHGHKFEGSHFC